MTIRMVCGPPAAGKNTYIDQHRGDSDTVIDLDQIRETYPDLTTARAIRRALEGTAAQREEDVWVIRTLSDPEVRAKKAAEIAAEEVIVLATPADEAKRRAACRDSSADLTEPIDRWWSTYQPNDTDTVITPDMGTAIRQGEQHMGDTQQQNGNGNTGAGQQQQNGTGGNDGAGQQDQSQNNNGTGQQQNNQQQEQNGNTDRGFPENTPVAEMEPAQQAAYWKFHSRKHEQQAARYSDYDDIKALADKWRQHEQQQLPEQERQLQQATEAAKQEAATEERKKFGPRLVKAEFKAQAGGTVDAEKLGLILDDLNFDLYIKDDGEVDVERVKSRVAALPAASAQSPNNQRRNSHQGYQPAGGTTSVAAGADMYAAKRGKQNS